MSHLFTPGHKGTVLNLRNLKFRTTLFSTWSLYPIVNEMIEGCHFVHVLDLALLAI